MLAEARVAAKAEAPDSWRSLAQIIHEARLGLAAR